ncbi:hypothetical protein RJ641_030774, partial [Dillenia turbinata]
MSIAIYLTSSFTVAHSVHGCGGFVEASPSLIKSRKSTNAKFDYSHITLQTVDGLVKERKNSMSSKWLLLYSSLRQDGWSWDPDKVPVLVDHKCCNSNEDINFRFTRFTLSGSVVEAVGGDSCSVKNGGPSNVAVKLMSPNGDLISSVHTSSMRVYSFTNVIPGKYILRASHPDLKVEARGSTEGNPILGVHIYLYSDDVSEVYCPQGSGKAPGGKKALCHATSDADGLFVFKSIRCGIYELIPYNKGENTVFDVSPPLMELSVEHHHLSISQKFQVTGFSVGGPVIDNNGMGVDSARVIVNGGGLSLINMEITNLTSNSFDISGVVHIASSGSKAKVALTHGPENVKPQVRWTDESGNFCFEVPLGEYRLSALAASPESVSELLFSPPHVDVVVKSPVLNVEFSQAHVSLHGTVSCKEICGLAVSTTLMKHTPDTMFGEDNWCWEQNSVDVDPIFLKGEKYLLKGKILADLSSERDGDELPEDIIVDVLNSEGTMLSGTTARCIPGGDEQKSSVSPPLLGVYISIIAERDNHNTELKKGELALEATTGTDGVFVRGPLCDDISYSIHAFKFAFSPSAQAIELDYGESREVIFQASCVAYSAMGVVTVLSGQPKEGFVIEARAVLKGFYEGRITDSSGIVEKDDPSNNKIERASPESVSIKVGSEYIKGKDLRRDKHLVLIRSGLPSKSLKFYSHVVEFDLVMDAQVHMGPLGYRFEEDHLKQ